MPHAIIFRSARLYELDMVREALKNAGVPHFMREETLSGVRTAFPAAPTPGIGVIWCVLVPEEKVEEARKIVEALPIDPDQDPGYMDFTTKPWAIKTLKVLAWAAILFFFVLLFREIIVKAF